MGCTGLFETLLMAVGGCVLIIAVGGAALWAVLWAQDADRKAGR